MSGSDVPAAAPRRRDAAAQAGRRARTETLAAARDGRRPI